MSIKKRNLILVTILTSFTIFTFSPEVLAQDTPRDAKNTVLEGLDKTANPAGFENEKIAEDPGESLATFVGRAVNFLFGPVAIIFFIFILIGGYQWMIAKGNEERIAKAKKFILNGIWGMIVIFFAWTLVIVILNALNAATNTG